MSFRVLFQINYPECTYACQYSPTSNQGEGREGKREIEFDDGVIEEFIIF